MIRESVPAMGLGDGGYTGGYAIWWVIAGVGLMPWEGECSMWRARGWVGRECGGDALWMRKREHESDI